MEGQRRPPLREGSRDQPRNPSSHREGHGAPLEVSAGFREVRERTVERGESSRAGALVKPSAIKQTVRPGFGFRGAVVELLCNHFKTIQTNQEAVCQYHLEINPDISRREDFFMRRKVIDKLRDTYGVQEFQRKGFAYDGNNNFYVVGELHSNVLEFQVYVDESTPRRRPGPRRTSPGEGTGSPGEEAGAKRMKVPSRGQTFEVTLTFATKIDMRSIKLLLLGQAGPEVAKSQDAIRVYDVVLREIAASRNYLLVRDNFFSKTLNQEVGDLGEGVEGWRGFHASIRAGNRALTLNLDITMTTVIKHLHIDKLLEEKFGKPLRWLSPQDWKKAKSMLDKIKVVTKHVQRIHTIRSFSTEPIGQLKFSRKVTDHQGNVKEEEISVRDYYKRIYNIILKYPECCAINAGTSKKPSYLPIELCEVVAGQRYTQTLSRNQRQKQIGMCKQPPEIRRRLCESAMSVIQYSTHPLIKEFGLQFDSSMFRVQGRILPTPTLIFGAEARDRPRGGRWNFNMKRMFIGKEVKAWLIINFDPRCRNSEAKRMAWDMVQCCKKRGMTWDEPPRTVLDCPISSQPAELQVVEVKKKLETMDKPQFVLAILPNNQSAVYAPLKRLFDAEEVITQCVVPSSRMNDQYWGNVALKINLKMGGLNSSLDTDLTPILKEVTIVFGMDVSHGSPGSKSPSIAAVVASTSWPNIGRYAIAVRTQLPRSEMIEGLHDKEKGAFMIIDLLNEFYNTSAHRKPAHIIVYRDGVSESQFDQCLQMEVTAFKRACESLEEGYNPLITFIVAQKRHYTRFFPGRGAENLKGNIVPGTVVDNGVCHPQNYDFFLCSHAGIGTVRPTHYNVIYDENLLTPDELQQLTNNLCYTFNRCTTSVAQAAPSAYAHCVALRYRKILDSGMESRSDTSGEEVYEKIATMREHKSMFFC